MDLTIEEIKKLLDPMKADFTVFCAKAAEEMKNLGQVNQDTLAKMAKMQVQMDALDVKLQQKRLTDGPGSLMKDLEENESLRRLMKDGKGNARITFKGGLPELIAKFTADMEAKTTITSSAVGAATSGVLAIDRSPGIVPAARRRLFLGDLLTRIPTSFQVIDFVKVNADILTGSPQTEGSAKAENAMTFTTASQVVQTIATWIPASKQILADFPGLQQLIGESLRYAVKLQEEYQLLFGDNTGTNLNGLTVQAQAFDTNLLVASDGYEYVDYVGRAINQIQVDNENEPNFVAMNPTAWWNIRLSKDANGNYIFGPPNMPGPQQFFGLTPVPTNSLAATKFLVGDSSPMSAVIREREDLQVDISTEHANFFTENKVAIRAEERIALIVYRPNAFVYGTFATSPA